MNRGVFIILIPCLVSFILIQAIQGMYGGTYWGHGMYGGYGDYWGYAGNPYAGFRAGSYYGNARENTKTSAIFSALIGFFVIFFLFNGTGQILG